MCRHGKGMVTITQSLSTTNKFPGPLPLCPLAPPPQRPHPRLYQFHLRRPPPDPISPKPRSPSPTSPLPDATKSSHALNRALLRRRQHSQRLHPRRHRRSRPRTRHTQHPARDPLPLAPRRGRIRASFRPHSASRRDGLEYTDLWARRSGWSA